MSSKAKKLVVLSAPSGAGKSTLASMLLQKHPKIFALSVSHTTRAPRGAEKHGTHYFFVSETEFKKMVDEDKFLEHALVFGKSWYGTSRKFVESALSSGKHVLFDIDVQGAASLKKAYGKRCITVFIHPPSVEELALRLQNRKTESKEAIAMRMKTAQEELKQAPSFDHQLVNRELPKTFAELEQLLVKEGVLE